MPIHRYTTILCFLIFFLQLFDSNTAGHFIYITSYNERQIAFKILDTLHNKRKKKRYTNIFSFLKIYLPLTTNTVNKCKNEEDLGSLSLSFSDEND